MLMTSKVTRLEVYNVNVQALDSDYELEVNVAKVNKSELLFVENQRYENLIDKFSHLKAAKLYETETKASLPVHIVLGSGEYAKVKTT